MSRRPLKSLVVVSLILFLGMPWMFLQTVAWVGMVVSYSQSMPMKSAVAKALDGRHPCAICKVVQKGQKKEKEQSSPGGNLKFEFLSNETEWALYPPQIQVPDCAAHVLLALQRESPPIPPPRFQLLLPA